MIRAFISSTLLLAVSCALPTPPFGRRCDSENPCPDGYLCADDACVPDGFAADAGWADGGVADAGPADGG